MTRIIAVIAVAALAVCQVAGQSSSCSLPVNGAQLPPELDPLGCSAPGGLRPPNFDLTRDCVTYVAGASLPRFFDPYGCTRPGGVWDRSDPSYDACNTQGLLGVPVGLERIYVLGRRCNDIGYVNGRLVYYYGNGQQYYYLTGDGRYVQQGYVQPGSTQTGYVQPGNTQTGYVQPGNTQTGYVQPGNTQTGYVQPGNTQTGYVQPGNTQTDYVQPVY